MHNFALANGKYDGYRRFFLIKIQHRGVEQLVARQAHNLEVARSSRTPATRKEVVVEPLG